MKQKPKKHIRNPRHDDKDYQRLMSIDNHPTTTRALQPPRQITTHTICEYMSRMGYPKAATHMMLNRAIEFIRYRLKYGDEIDLSFVRFFTTVEFQYEDHPFMFHDLELPQIETEQAARPPLKIGIEQIAEYLSQHGYTVPAARKALEIAFEFCRNRLANGDTVNLGFSAMQMIPQFLPQSKRIVFDCRFATEPAKEDYHRFPQTSPREAHRMYENYIKLYGYPQYEYDKWIEELGYRDRKSVISENGEIEIPRTRTKTDWKKNGTKSAKVGNEVKSSGSWVATITEGVTSTMYTNADNDIMELLFDMFEKYIVSKGYSVAQKNGRRSAKYIRGEDIATFTKEYRDIFAIEKMNHPHDFDILESRGAKTFNAFVGKVREISVKMKDEE